MRDKLMPMYICTTYNVIGVKENGIPVPLCIINVDYHNGVINYLDCTEDLVIEKLNPKVNWELPMPF